jgi:hypothetical protein
MSFVLISVVVWRAAALAVWFVIVVGAVEIVWHILHPQRHRVRMLK